MRLEPFDWSVVVIGRWNRAILTPAGIGKRLFKVDEGTPLEVLIAIDALGPPLVKHDGLTVVAGSDRLIVRPDLLNGTGIRKSCEIATNAISSLPETPLTAVGVNLKYSCGGYFEEIDAAMACDIDLRAADLALEPIESQFQKSYKFGDGRVNLMASIGEDCLRTLAFNFELQNPTKDDHLTWLSTPSEKFLSLVSQISENLFQIPKSSITYETQTD